MVSLGLWAPRIAGPALAALPTVEYEEEEAAVADAPAAAVPPRTPTPTPAIALCLMNFRRLIELVMISLSLWR
jgi:hypothetical protein